MRFPVRTLLLALGACAGAQAQVTLSGFVDVNMESIKSGGHTVRRITSAGLNTSRLQFKAEEDLGGGLKAKAVYEFTFNADSGTNGSPRETYVQLSSPAWGELNLGRLNLPSYYVYGYADPTWSADYSMVSNMVVFYAPFRESNALVYNTPRMAGLQVKLGFTAGKEDGSKNGRVTSIGADYRNGPLYLGIARDTKYQNNIFAAANMEVSHDLYASAVYRMGSVELTGVYSRYKGYYAFPPFVDFRSSGHNLQIGTRWNIDGLSRVYASVVRKSDDNNVKLSDATGFVVGYLYGLSKRTDLYATYAQVHHSHASGLRYPVSFSAATVQGGENPHGMQFGIRHAF